MAYMLFGLPASASFIILMRNYRRPEPTREEVVDAVLYEFNLDVTKPREAMTIDEINALIDVDCPLLTGAVTQERHEFYLSNFKEVTAFWRSWRPRYSEDEIDRKFRRYFWPQDLGKTDMETRPNAWNYSDHTYGQLVADLLMLAVIYRKVPLGAVSISKFLSGELRLNPKREHSIPWINRMGLYPERDGSIPLMRLSLPEFRSSAAKARADQTCLHLEWRGRSFFDAIRNWADHWIRIGHDHHGTIHRMNVLFGVDVDKPREQWDAVERHFYHTYRNSGWW
ncbi:hypothetical protein FA15DRAFT_745520 [Coprinopsis marcescibilis]|uniref:Uncharacterized protein n=1 Tax=Coprinopsis marcescibilis TaxID=230819 RepID=A0A5C3KSZ4_COPMA|nr:hypothetical protein FA15DRAFT_745520 [Coprinopsis marcescibilis]